MLLVAALLLASPSPAQQPSRLDREIDRGVAAVAGNAVTWNDPALTQRMLGTLRRVWGDSAVTEARMLTVSEDFSAYTRAVPGMYFFLGITPRGQDPAQAAPNHSPLFFADEAAFPVGVRAMAHLAVDYLRGGSDTGIGRGDRQNERQGAQPASR